jgi:hypothetical protein
LTLRVKVVVLPSGLPVTVIVEEPAAAVAAAVRVRVVEQVGLQEAAEKFAVTPPGSPVTAKLTDWVEPVSSVAVMVVEPGAPPAVSATEVGLAASE